MPFCQKSVLKRIRKHFDQLHDRGSFFDRRRVPNVKRQRHQRCKLSQQRFSAQRYGCNGDTDAGRVRLDSSVTGLGTFC